MARGPSRAGTGDAVKSKSAHRAGVNHTGKAHSRQAVEYSASHGPAHVSVYSPACVLHLVYSSGKCEGCKHVFKGERDLIDGYCATCRGNGANEHQCLNPALIGRSEQGRVNSQKSMWRKNRVKA